ncbi:DNA replication complex GINS protein SLD5 [Striga asiatica]|uniref:DNA replication complex GINS protein SLD5 n=1 Tax=Striga asiatica TaxID=4170 RepID=A0A5A7PBF6_STRAF|nr:DNA replication complex GINS protein SLD5 [Striga asiatica]
MLIDLATLTYKKKLRSWELTSIVYRIPDAGVGADSLRDVTDDKGVMEIISCGKNKKTIVQIYVVGGDINDGEEDENVEASFQTKSSSQQDTDDGEEVNGLSQAEASFHTQAIQQDIDDREEVNGLSQAEASIEKEPADQLEDINDIIDNFTSVEHGEGDAETNSACAGLGSQESSDDEDYFPTRVSSSDDDMSDDHLSDDDEYVQARKNLKEFRKKVQDWDDDAGYTHPMATAEIDFEEDELSQREGPESILHPTMWFKFLFIHMGQPLVEEEGRGVGLPLLEEEEEGKVVGLPLLEEEEEGKVQGTSYALKRVRLEIKM